jgi:hypothetical protein
VRTLFGSPCSDSHCAFADPCGTLPPINICALDEVKGVRSHV